MRARWLLLAVGFAALLALVLLWPRDEKPADGAPSESVADTPPTLRPPARRRPRGPRRPPFARADAGARDTSLDAAVAEPSNDSTADAGKRVEQLHIAVLKDAVRADWVFIDERGTPCPPEKIRIVYDAPADLRSYEKGAYFEPLGPTPGESANEVNGLLLCEGHTFLYRGFEAYFRPDRGQWEVFPFPVIE